MQTETKGIFKGFFSAKADSQAAREIKELTKELKDLRSQRHQLEKDNKELSDRVEPVSYTHLTLPTIYSV